MSDSQRADSLARELYEVKKELLESRGKVAKEIFSLALKVKRQGAWHIGGFLGEVEEEWEWQENKRQ